MADHEGTLNYYVRFFDKLIDIVGAERLRKMPPGTPPGQSVERDVIMAVERMAVTLNLLAGMLPEEYVRASAERGESPDASLLRALAPIITVWRVDTWERRSC